MERGVENKCYKNHADYPLFCPFFHTLAMNELLVIAVLVKASLCQTSRTQNTLLIPHQKITVSLAIERA